MGRVKDASNRAKHGIGLSDAATIFTSGAEYVEIHDAAHSAEEDRWIAIGPIATGVVTVVFTERGEDCLRIISARPATKREVATYVQRVKGRHP